MPYRIQPCILHTGGFLASHLLPAAQRQAGRGTLLVEAGSCVCLQGWMLWCSLRTKKSVFPGLATYRMLQQAHRAVIAASSEAAALLHDLRQDKTVFSNCCFVVGLGPTPDC